MANRYRVIYLDIWNNPKTKKILKGKNKDILLVYIYIISAPTSNVSGLYSLPIYEIAGRFAIAYEKVEEILMSLQNEYEWIKYDYDNEVVLVPNMFKRSIPNPSVFNYKGVASILIEIKSPLFDEFLTIYPEVRQYIGDKPTIIEPVEKKKPRNISKKHATSIPKFDINNNDDSEEELPEPDYGVVVK